LKGFEKMANEPKFKTIKTFGNLKGTWGRDDEKNTESAKEHGEEYTRKKGISFKYLPDNTKTAFINSVSIRIDTLNIPIAYKNATFKTIEEVLKYEKGGFLFYGSNSTGKTYTAYAILKFRILMEICRSVEYRHPDKKDKKYFVYCQDLFNDLRESYNDPTINRRAIIKKYSECDLLILDDLGAEKITEFTSGNLRNILNYRDAHHKDTIITTNFKTKELTDLIGTSIMERIKRLCKFVKLNEKYKE
jgi:DNA replication protein DnaC